MAAMRIAERASSEQISPPRVTCTRLCEDATWPRDAKAAVVTSELLHDVVGLPMSNNTPQG
jgi:hypothetical protein